MELGSVTDGRPGPARQNGVPLMSSSAATRRRSHFCRARAWDSRSALHACRGLETQVLRAEYRGPETQCPFIEVLELRSWEPNAATRQQQKKGAASVCLSPETQLSRPLIGFLGRYQYIKKRVLSFKFLGFLGDGFGVKGRVGVWVVVFSPSFNYGLSIYGSLKTIQVKGKKKPGTGGLCPTVTGTH
jgi:hypothetical protein